jgi:hypothetical protein
MITKSSWRKTPPYLANLKALSLVERARLLDGNWNMRATAGNYFRREWFGIVDAALVDVQGHVRYLIVRRLSEPAMTLTPQLGCYCRGTGRAPVMLRT